MIPPGYRQMIPFRLFSLLFLLLAVSISRIVADTPADFTLDCTIRGGNEIFSPQQSIILDVSLRSPSPNSVPLALHAALIDLSLPERPRLDEFNKQIPVNTPVPIPFVTPDKEGVYEIIFSAVIQESKSSRPLANLPVNLPVNLPRQAIPVPRRVVETRRQFIVLAPQSPQRAVGDWTLTDKRTLPPVDSSTGDTASRRFPLPSFPKVAELPRISDISIPRQITLPRIPTFAGRISPHSSSENEEIYSKLLWRCESLPFSQRHFLENSEQHPEFSALPPAGIDKIYLDRDKRTWYSLPIDVEIGMPYLVEIDFPANIPQTFVVGIFDSLLNQRHNDSWDARVNVATAIHVAEEIVQDTSAETAATHRLLFWAATEHPELVLINRQRDKEALFRNIRISRVVTPCLQENQGLPKLFEGTAQRKRIGQVGALEGLRHLANAHKHEPMNWEQFRANDVLDPMDCLTAYEGCSRLLDILHRGGYDGVTIPVHSFFSSQLPNVDDTRVKDELYKHLEMMFRRFSNEGLTLIPALAFSMPIPALEQLRQQYPAVTDEIYINSADGLLRYNILHPAVQQAIAEMVLELVDRFERHSSFGGVAIVLSPQCYTQLPFAMYAPDDDTFVRFRQDTEQTLEMAFPDEQYLRQTMPIQQFLEQKKAGRIQFLQSDPKIWETWVRWRAATVSGFYADLAEQISTQRVHTPLYLLGGVMLDSSEIEQFCTPTLPKNFTPLQAIQLLGFDLSLISQTESLHFLKPVQVSETKKYCYEGLNSASTAPLFSKSGMMSGVEFVHPGSDTTAGSRSGGIVATPAGDQSRKRFVQQLAQADVQMFMDGGVSLPFGQESAMFDLLNTYRQLPPVSFQTFQPSGESMASLQPLTIRYYNSPDEMIVYIVNDAPFAVEADFAFSADARNGMSMSELTGHRIIRSCNPHPQRSGSYTWRTSLQPYELLAIRISDAQAKIESVTVIRPSDICGAEGKLKQKIEDLARRIHVARAGVPVSEILNADFELPADAAGNIAGWECFGKSLTAQLDQTVVCQGKYSVKLTNSSTDQVGFYGEALEIPATGRLAVSMFVGVPADCPSLPLSVSIAAMHRDKPFHRAVPIGERLMPILVNVEPKNGVRWRQVIVPFERLPTESLEGVRIGVQYSGMGTVWIDDVNLYPVLFSANEMVELQKMLVVADQRCSSGRVSDLIMLLEDYWMQFLWQHVPAAPLMQPAVVASKSLPSKDAVSPKPSTLYQRMKGWVGL